MADALSLLPNVAREAPWTFESALKDATVEEWINLHLHRRLAFVLVRQMQGRFAWVSPNHLTLLSGAIGVCAGVCSYRSVERGNAWLAMGAVLLMASAVFDCADGMLARLRRQSSEFGRLLDGVSDYVVGLSAWYGICYAVCSGIELRGKWLYCSFALFSVVVRTSLYDEIRDRFVALTSARPSAARATSPQGRFERWAGKLHRNLYGRIMRVFAGEAVVPSGDPGLARRNLSPAMRKVTYLGLGTQLFVLYMAALVGALTHVWVTFALAQLLLSVLLNAWTAVSIVSWKRSAASLRAESSAP